MSDTARRRTDQDARIDRLRAFLVKFANQLQFGKYVLLGKGEELTGGRTRPALLADVFESFIGALYLDQGLEPVREFLRNHIFPQISLDGKLQTNDYKTQLQELTQHHNLGRLSIVS